MLGDTRLPSTTNQGILGITEKAYRRSAAERTGVPLAWQRVNRRRRPAMRYTQFDTSAAGTTGDGAPAGEDVPLYLLPGRARESIRTWLLEAAARLPPARVR